MFLLVVVVVVCVFFRSGCSPPRVVCAWCFGFCVAFSLDASYALSRTPAGACRGIALAISGRYDISYSQAVCSVARATIEETTSTLEEQDDEASDSLLRRFALLRAVFRKETPDRWDEVSLNDALAGMDPLDGSALVEEFDTLIRYAPCLSSVLLDYRFPVFFVGVFFLGTFFPPLSGRWKCVLGAPFQSSSAH